nr:cation transporter [Pseudoruegeria sp. HB172150]
MADIVIVILQTFAAITSGSFTMLGECVRAAFMTIIEIFSTVILRGVHRDRFGHFEFGIGKVEQFAWLVFGISLIASGLWVATQVIGSLGSPERAAGPLGLAIAAIVNAINLMINGLSLRALLAASEERESDVFRAQVLTRSIKFSNSIVLQILLTLAAISTDPLFAHLLDVIGATIVVVVMLHSGVSMVASAMPALLDAPLPPTMVDRVRTALATDPVSGPWIAALRSRSSGRFPQVEVTVNRHHVHDPDWERNLDRLQTLVHEIDPAIELRIVVDKEPRESAPDNPAPV